MCFLYKFLFFALADCSATSSRYRSCPPSEISSANDQLHACRETDLDQFGFCKNFILIADKNWKKTER